MAIWCRIMPLVWLVGCQHDRHVDLGGIVLCQRNVGVPLRIVGAHTLRFMGRLDDSFHLSLWPALSQAGAQGAYAGGGHAGTARHIQPVEDRKSTRLNSSH